MTQQERNRLFRARMARIEREQTWLGLWAIARDLGLPGWRRLMAWPMATATVRGVVTGYVMARHDAASGLA